MVEELSRWIKELESKRGGQEKEKVRPKLSGEAVETVLLEKGVPKWIGKLGAALVQLFQDLEAPEGMKPIQFRSNDVWATMWGMKESCANKYHHTSTECQDNRGRSSQSQGSKPRKKHNLSVEQMLAEAEESTARKSKRGTSGLWSMRDTSST